MRRVLLGAGLAAALLGAAPASGPASPPLAELAKRTGWDPYAAPTRATFRALGLVGKAMDYVERTRRRCRPRFPDAQPTHDAPSAELLALLAILRRPAGPEDRLPPEDLSGEGVYVDWVRVARDASGDDFFVFPSRGRGTFGPPACGKVERRRLRALLVGQPRRVARVARRMNRSFAARWTHPSRPRRTTEWISLFERQTESSFDVGSGITSSGESLRTHGLWLRPHGTRRFTLLLPDGVATITVEFPRVGHKPLRGPRRIYDARVKRTVAVQDNLASFTSPRRRWDLYPTRVVWRAADGSTIRVTPPQAFWWLF